jgi:hypothetical protein
MPVDKGERCFEYNNFLNPSKQKSKKAITVSQSNIHCHTTTKYHLNPSMTVQFQSERDNMEKRELTSIKQDFINFDTSKPE